MIFDRARARRLDLVRKIYDAVQVALWSSLVAAVIFFCTYTVPQMAKFRAENEAKSVQAIATENIHYCSKWGFAKGTHRAKIEERRTAEDSL